MKFFSRLSAPTQILRSPPFPGPGPSRSVTLLGGSLLLSLPSAALFAQAVSFAGPQPAVQFSAVNFCKPDQAISASCTETMTLPYKVTQSGALGPIKVLTSGAPGLDYTLAAGSTCVGSVKAGTSCTVNVRLTAIYAGDRNGAVQLTAENGRVLATTLLHGVAYGGQIAFNGVAPAIVPGTSTGLAAGLVVDGVGDVFFLNAYDPEVNDGAQVLEVPAGSNAAVVLPFNGASEITALAVDGAGDVFAGDSGSGRILELPAGGGPQLTLPFTGLSQVEEILVDDIGDVFVTNLVDSGCCTTTTSVQELPLGGKQIKLSGGGVGSPDAADANGDLFYVNLLAEDESFVYTVVEKTPGGEDIPLYSADKSQFVPEAIAADGMGNAIVADGATHHLLEIPVGGGKPAGVVSAFSLAGISAGLGVNSAGDLFVLDEGTSAIPPRVYALRRSQAPSLNFGSIPLGTTRTLPLAITNIGNEPLVLTPSFESASYKILKSASGGCPSSIAVGQTCTLQIQFSALTAGAHRIDLTLGSNGAPDAVVPLQGIAINQK